MNQECSFNSTEYAARFARDGYFVFPSVLPFEDVARLRAAIHGIPAGEAVRQKETSVYGVRNLLETSPEICDVATRRDVWHSAFT